MKPGKWLQSAEIKFYIAEINACISKTNNMTFGSSLEKVGALLNLSNKSTSFHEKKITIFLYYSSLMDNLCSLRAFSVTKDKLGRTQLRGKRCWGFYSNTHVPSKIQPAKNKWACHHRSENSLGLLPVFGGLLLQELWSQNQRKGTKNHHGLSITDYSWSCCARVHKSKGEEKRSDGIAEEFSHCNERRI